MEHKLAEFQIKGMNQDLSPSKFNPEFAYENKNLRIYPSGDNTMLSLINEKGTKELSINNADGSGNLIIEGTTIGKAVVGNNIILFTHKEGVKPTDYIYKIYELQDKSLEGYILFIGNLNFDTKHPIETLVSYESDKIQKVYWVDGKNMPRVINVATNESDTTKFNNTSFDFIGDLTNIRESIEGKIHIYEEVNINRSTTSNGLFAPGTIQYAFTYYNKNGKETNIFYLSELLYISNEDRGASPEDKVNNVFNISIKNLNVNYDFIRIYSIHRTSINSTPEVKRIIDLKTTKASAGINYTDTGLEGEIIDSTRLLYVGGEPIIASTIADKDNVLFLGDIKTSKRTFTEAQIATIKSHIDLSFVTKKIDTIGTEGTYIYNNQLSKGSNIKGFKGGETYNIAIQFKDKYGKYSEPIILNKKTNTLYPEIVSKGSTSDILVPTLKVVLNSSPDLAFLTSDDYNYTSMRVLIDSNPLNKTVLCQGVLCPTLFNLKDRKANLPFSISSWFFRTNGADESGVEWRHTMNLPSCYSRNCEIQSTHETNIPYINSNSGTTIKGTYQRDFYEGIEISNLTAIYYTKAGVQIKVITEEFEGADNEVNAYNKIEARIKEFLYLKESKQDIYYPSLASWQKINTGEVSNPYNIPYIESDKLDFINKYSNNYYVDQSIVTMHSPEIEENTNLIENSTVKCRIVGVVEPSSVLSDYSILTKTTVRDPGCIGQISYNSDKSNNLNGTTSTIGGLISAPLWNDSVLISKDETIAKRGQFYRTLLPIYPWHRTTSLTNDDSRVKDEVNVAELERKVISNLRYCYNTKYYMGEDAYGEILPYWKPLRGITKVSIFNSNEVTNTRIENPKNSPFKEGINYYGNVDTNIFSSKAYPIMALGMITKTPVTITDKPSDPNNPAYSIYDDNDYLKIIDNPYQPLSSINEDTFVTSTKDPISIKYKSTPHAVFGFNYNDNGESIILPSRMNNGVDKVTTYLPRLADYELPYIEGKSNCSISQDSTLSNKSDTPYIYLAELYRDPSTTTIEKTSFNWIPASNDVSLIKDNSCIIDNTIGDTYFQRWDCLKTYSFDNNDANSVIDILSFMCESRINLDGRYDRNRGQKNNLSVTPLNFNLYNKAYNQQNNYFSYKVLDDRFSNNDFPTTITWSLPKHDVELIDTWTNTTMASTLVLDGNKGKLNALRKVNNDILAFQDTGISQVLYNENVQINSTNGVPIEIANSNKVQGKRYLSGEIGCTNKWSISTSSNAIYFIDSITRNIFKCNTQGIENISDTKGFHTWCYNNCNITEPWNPEDFNNIVSYYNPIDKEIMFINNSDCLVYSESLGVFTSFYSYERTPYFINLQDRNLLLRDNKLWGYHEGKYNNFFNYDKEFYTTIIANPDITTDKIFDNVEFRADTWKYEDVGDGDWEWVLKDDTFNFLSASNEYQYGSSKLEFNKNKVSNLKRKFRIWRANIPRSNSNHRDRIRNPWAYIKLAKVPSLIDTSNNNNKTVLHDITVHYFG